MRALSSVTEEFTDAVGGLNLAQGFPDFAPPDEVRDAAMRAMVDQGGVLNQYPVTFGEPALREAIARKAGAYNGISCDPDTDITVTCGATEAMIATLKAIINPGDEVIIFEPFSAPPSAPRPRR